MVLLTRWEDHRSRDPTTLPDDILPTWPLHLQPLPSQSFASGLHCSINQIISFTHMQFHLITCLLALHQTLLLLLLLRLQQLLYWYKGASTNHIIIKYCLNFDTEWWDRATSRLSKGWVTPFPLREGGQYHRTFLGCYLDPSRDVAVSNWPACIPELFTSSNTSSRVLWGIVGNSNM